MNAPPAAIVTIVVLDRFDRLSIAVARDLAERVVIVVDEGSTSAAFGPTPITSTHAAPPPDWLSDLVADLDASRALARSVCRRLPYWPAAAAATPKRLDSLCTRRARPRTLYARSPRRPSLSRIRARRRALARVRSTCVRSRP